MLKTIFILILSFSAFIRSKSLTGAGKYHADGYYNTTGGYQGDVVFLHTKKD
jgi:pectate lyase